MANLMLTDVGKTYGGTVEVLKNINLDITAGELIVFGWPLRLRQVHPAADDRRA